MPKIGDIVKGVKIGHKKDYHKFVLSACIDCGKERWVRLYKNNPAQIRCRSCAKKGEYNGNWIGGKMMHTGGYIYILALSNDIFTEMRGKNGYILEHRLEMAKHLGRPLKVWEIVHHVNGERDDNRIENLTLVNRKEHGGVTSKLCRRINILEKENRKLKKELKELKSE